MWKKALICSSLLIGCKDWKRNPDGAVEQFVEQALETAVEQGAAVVGTELDIEIDFTPAEPELPVRSEASQPH